MDTTGRFREYLREEKLFLTLQREQIATTVMSMDGHFSVEELALVLKKKNLRIGLATIYRTLALMVSSGVVREHDFGVGFRKFERIIDKRHHDHLICEDCGEVIEFEVPDIERLQEVVIDKLSFDARDHELVIYGLCRKCSTEID